MGVKNHMQLQWLSRFQHIDRTTIPRNEIYNPPQKIVILYSPRRAYQKPQKIWLALPLLLKKWTPFSDKYEKATPISSGDPKIFIKVSE